MLSGRDLSFNVAALVLAIVSDDYLTPEKAIAKLEGKAYRYTHEDEETMYNLRKEGLTLEEISRIYNISKSYVSRKIGEYERNGIKKGSSRAATLSEPNNKKLHVS